MSRLGKVKTRNTQHYKTIHARAFWDPLVPAEDHLNATRAADYVYPFMTTVPIFCCLLPEG